MNMGCVSYGQGWLSYEHLVVSYEREWLSYEHLVGVL